MSLKGKVAIITGASRGIGRECALALARRGCNIVIAAKSAELDAASKVAPAEQLALRKLSATRSAISFALPAYSVLHLSL